MQREVPQVINIMIGEHPCQNAKTMCQRLKTLFAGWVTGG